MRNPVLGNVFFRMHYIEMFGTGVRRILLAYENAKIKPKFEITDNVISVILPVITNQYHITSDEEKIINVLENGKQLSSSEIVKATGYTKSKVLRLIEHLKEKDYIKVTGKGRGTKYSFVGGCSFICSGGICKGREQQLLFTGENPRKKGLDR